MTCEGKAVYPSQWVADRKASLAVSRSGGHLIQPYYCCAHDGWHIGHPPGSGRLTEERTRRPRRRR